MKEEIILRKVLTDNHSKITQPRLTVFRLLLGQHPQSLSELTQRTDGIIDRVTVYRVIDLFEKLGIVRRVTIGWKYKIELSEIFLDHHHHLVCIECNKVVAIKEDASIERAIQQLAHNTGFTVTTHQLELQGCCKKCQKRLKSPYPI